MYLVPASVNAASVPTSARRRRRALGQDVGPDIFGAFTPQTYNVPAPLAPTTFAPFVPPISYSVAQAPQIPAGSPSIFGPLSTAAPLTITPPSPDPLGYVSPQAAIAAGLDANTVNAAWTAAVNKYPTAQAAIAAGVPAGVVTSLWKGAVAAPATAAGWLDQSPLGVKNKYLVGIGAAVVGLAALHKGRG